MNKVYINISVDTENMNTLFYNKKYKKSILYTGTKQIVEVLKQYNFQATFFLSIFEDYNLNYQEMKKVVELVKNYEVGLHTHPLWIEKENMHSYSLDEQVKLIQKGIELFEKYKLPKPNVHRGGAYGIDKNTILSLKKNNIFIDSSMFYSHPNCKEIWSKNQVVKIDNMIEFPITIFKRKMYDLDGDIISTKIVKTDINSMFYSEFVQFVEFCRNSDIKYINLFMHSYSLMKFENGSFKENTRDIKKIHKIFKYILDNNDIEIVSLQDLSQKKLHNKEYDFIPNINTIFNHELKPEDNY